MSISLEKLMLMINCLLKWLKLPWRHHQPDNILQFGQGFDLMIEFPLRGPALEVGMALATNWYDRIFVRRVGDFKLSTVTGKTANIVATHLLSIRIGNQVLNRDDAAGQLRIICCPAKAWCLNPHAFFISVVAAVAVCSWLVFCFTVGLKWLVSGCMGSHCIWKV